MIGRGAIESAYQRAINGRSGGRSTDDGGMAPAVREAYEKQMKRTDLATFYSLTWEELGEVERRREEYAKAHGHLSGAECDRIRDAYAREIGRI